MKSRIAIVVFLVAVVCYADGLFAEGGGLAEQYKKALTPEGAQESQQLPEKRLRGLGGVTQPSLTMHLEFKFNSEELTPQTVKYLDALGTALQDPVLSGYIYRVEGHTDNVGTDAYNLDLSRRRALSVVDYMVKTFGLERDQFDVQGFGKKKPVAPNDTEEGRQQNRRVVIVNTLQNNPRIADERPKITVKVKYSRAKEEKDLQDGGTLTQRDNYAIEFTPKTSAHVYIYQIDSMNNLTQIFPNPQFSQSSNHVEPGRLYRVPDLGKWLFLDESKGKEHIVVIAQKDELQDPFKVCKKLLGSEQTMIVSAKPPARATETESKTRGLGGAREERSVQGIRPDKPIEVADGSEVKPTPPTPESGTESASPQPEPPNPIDMRKVFFWKLSFMHQ